MIVKNDGYRNPITKEEISEVRARLRLSDKATLKNAAPIQDDAGVSYIKEECQVIAKYPHVVIFRRPNGRECSRTYVELCMLARGTEI